MADSREPSAKPMELPAWVLTVVEVILRILWLYVSLT